MTTIEYEVRCDSGKCGKVSSLEMASVIIAHLATSRNVSVYNFRIIKRTITEEEMEI